MNRRVVIAGLILAATVVAYWPAVQGEFLWDDDENVHANSNVVDPGGIARTWADPYSNQQYYPLTHSSFWVEYRLWGAWPAGYHLTNIALHAICALLLWQVLLRLGVRVAGVAALVFALHPVNVESVAWITERKNVLAGAFMLASALVYLRYVGIGEPADQAKRRAAFWWLALALFACGLLAKTAIVPLPVVLAVLLWWKGRASPGEAARLSPFLGLAVVAGLVTAWLERHHVGAAGDEWSFNVAERLILAGKTVWFYPFKELWPVNLAFIYPRWEIDATSFLQYLPLLGAIVVVLGAWMLRDRIGRGPLAGLLCYSALIVPALGLFDLYFFRYSFVQDHFAYFAGMAMIPLLVAAAAWGIRDWPRLRIAAAVGVVLLLGSLTTIRARVFTNNGTLFRDTLRHNPDSWMAHGHLGRWLVANGQIDEGAEHLSRSASLVEGWELPRVLGELGAARLRQNRLSEGIDLLEQTVELMPEHSRARRNLARALLDANRELAAEAHLEILLRQDPADSLSLHRLGQIRMKQGHHDEAAALLEDAVRVNPDSPELHSELGMARTLQGRFDEAIEEFRVALRLDSNYFLAHHRMGLVQLHLGRPEDAAASLRAAIVIDPSFAPTHEALSRALAALEDAKGSVRPTPDEVDADSRNRE